MKLSDLRNTTPEDRRRMFTACKCAKCGCELSTAITGRITIDIGEVCEDCYYELVGDLFENNPPASLGTHRG